MAQTWQSQFPALLTSVRKILQDQYTPPPHLLHHRKVNYINQSLGHSTRNTPHFTLTGPQTPLSCTETYTLTRATHASAHTYIPGASPVEAEALHKSHL